MNPTKVIIYIVRRISLLPCNIPLSFMFLPLATRYTSELTTMEFYLILIKIVRNWSIMGKKGFMKAKL